MELLELDYALENFIKIYHEYFNYFYDERREFHFSYLPISKFEKFYNCLFIKLTKLNFVDNVSPFSFGVFAQKKWISYCENNRKECFHVCTVTCTSREFFNTECLCITLNEDDSILIEKHLPMKCKHKHYYEIY